MKKVFLVFFYIIITSCAEKHVVEFKIEKDDGFLYPVPVSIDMNKIPFTGFQLLNDDNKVVYQTDFYSNTIKFIHNPEYSLNYIIKKSTVETGDEVISEVVENNGNLQLAQNNIPVLQYKYGINKLVDKRDSVYRKSGYIHPLLTPSGDTLTRINPPDHKHHYGIWAPWTHTRIDTTRVDFWNLGKAEGTVLFKEFSEINEGEIFGSFTAVQEHIDFKTKKESQIAINENLSIKLWNLGDKDKYMLDYTTTFSSPLKNGILLEAYRYGGGIGMRFNKKWDKSNCKVLTSEGKSRLDGDGTNARWAIVTRESRSGNGVNGILFMSNINNQSHPEPMRIWPVDANEGRGDMFFEFCPIRNKEWKLLPNKKYKLQYRMVVFEGTLTANEAEYYWQNYANPPKIEIITTNNK